MALTERQIEAVARAYRNGIYGKAIEDTPWSSCKDHWIRDAKQFLNLLAACGLEIVEVKSKPKNEQKSTSTA